MPAIRPRNRSIQVIAATVIVAGLSVSAAWAGQRPEVQKHFQSGEYNEAIEAARDGDPASTYLAGQALLKLEQADRAVAEFRRLGASGSEAWRLIGESAEALVADDGARALDLARNAAAAEGDNPWAQYQLGLASAKQGDFGTASRAFQRSVEIKPDLAYGHYYAAQAWQRQRQLSKAAEHFELFLRLAPDAPEKSAVIAIMRTLK